MDSEIKNIILGVGLLIVAVFAIPLAQVLFFPGLFIWGAIFAIALLILALIILYQGFIGYRVTEFVEFTEEFGGLRELMDSARNTPLR